MTGRVYEPSVAAGNSLRLLRELTGHSLRQVAVRADVSRRLLSAVERGKRGAPPSFYSRATAACIALASDRDIPRAEQPTEASTWP
ncbi:Helix-turn-helix domain-containing protein [Microbacterium hydrothermale]|uniref:helix-turn-helix domain-containing protein n=1 Tax=Microbacterium hydrothermale TaxID=857427 RepID=UPI0022418432|nr:Helix-turn-helix domain-containing protein [Microbacterium hydrothermale]